MHYFFLEKQSPLTQRWKLRQIAFDAKYRYLYYSKALSRSDIEEVLTRSQAVATAAATHDDDEFSAASFASPGGGDGSRRTVKWSGKIKVTQLRYAADEYIVPPTSADFDERILLTLIVVGFERSLERPSAARAAPGSPNSGWRRRESLGDSVSYSRRSSNSRLQSTSRLSSARPTASEHGGMEDSRTMRSPATATEPLLGHSNPTESNAPESPSLFLHLPSYPVNESIDDELEDEDENLFRDIDLAPDDEEDEEEETSLQASELGSDDEDDNDDEAGDNAVLHSPLDSTVASTSSSYSFFSRRRPGGGEKTVQLQFRAANYDVFRIVSLRLRQTLVRHGICGPLHAGLPPYDPRNGIALATVPLHLRYAFRRLNDVVFYSLQIGHVVYVRQQREVRGIEGFLCITHDSILLLQRDGKCPRWLDLEDIVGVEYVISGNHSFISIRAADPFPDFIFIPIIPSYPPNSTFDPEECVEGIVSMVRRLLMQRLRAGEDVALPPLPSTTLSVQTAEDIEDYDILCHINDITTENADVFKYIVHKQHCATSPLRWRWDNSKTPTHFTFKRDLAQALEQEDEEESDEEDGGGGMGNGGSLALARSPRRPFLAAASHSHFGEAIMPSRKNHLGATMASSSISGGGGGRGSNERQRQGGFSLASSYSNASFLPATMTQLMAPPSRGAELRAKKWLQVTRTDRRTAVSPGPVGNTVPPPPQPTAPAGPFSSSRRLPASPLGHRSSAQLKSTPAAASSFSTTAGGTPSARYTPASSSHGLLHAAAAEKSSSAAVRESAKMPTAAAAAATATTSTIATTANVANASAARTTTKPNTYGLVPSQQHGDPTSLDYWFSSASDAIAPPVPPIATAAKGVHLSDIPSRPLMTDGGKLLGAVPAAVTARSIGDSYSAGSHSPQEVTHTTENASSCEKEEEDDDEDFDSEDMEDMLQRPTQLSPEPGSSNRLATVGLPTTANAGATGSSTVASSAPVAIPGQADHHLHVHDDDALSEGASAPSPSLQARPEMAVYIPPAVLP